MKTILELKIYKLYNVSTGYFEKTFDTLEDLLIFLSHHQHTDAWWGKYREGTESQLGYYNTYLDDVNMTFNDLKLVWDYNEKGYGLRTYVFLDPDNRIIDPREYIRDIIDLSKNPPKNKNWWVSKRYSNNLPEFRKGPVPNTGRRHWHRGSYYRYPQNMNIKRDSANTEYKEYIHPKNRIHNLPDPWDDIPRNHSKSWKDQSKKRKQWM